MLKLPLSGLRHGAVGLLAVAAMALGTSTAHGSLTPTISPFATFQNGNLHFTNNVAGGSGLFSDPSPPLAPIFSFLKTVSFSGHTYTAGQPISNVTLTLTSSASSAATGSPLVDQPLTAGTLKFTDVFGDNLLTVSGFTADLVGRVGGATENLSIDTTVGNVLTYSSDFITFNPNTVGISSTGLTLDNGSTVSVNNTDNLLNSFTANVDGTFSASVPEPATLGLLSLSGIILLARRRHD